MIRCDVDEEEGRRCCCDVFIDDDDEGRGIVEIEIDCFLLLLITKHLFSFAEIDTIFSKPAVQYGSARLAEAAALEHENDFTEDDEDLLEKCFSAT